MATLLPPPEIQFIDANGNPVAGGTAAFFVPGTDSSKDTYQDAGQTILNTNPVTLDSAGRAIVYGSGTYRLVLKDASGNLIYDQLTADTAVGGVATGGTSTGTPNAQVINASSFSEQNEQQITFVVGGGLTNTGGTTIAPGGGAGIPVLKDTASGPSPLTGGELVEGNAYTLIYDVALGAFHVTATPQSTPTTFEDDVFRVYNVSDNTKKIAFSAAGITTNVTRTVTAADASGVMMLTGAGQTTVASSSTANIGASPTVDVIISGTTTITNFGTVAAGTRRKGYFTGALTLTYNSTSLILPGQQSIVTASGDSFEAVSLGSGNWKVLWYQRLSSSAVRGLGIGQSWAIVSRAIGTNYQNTTGYPIEVGVQIQSNNSAWVLEVSSDGVSFVIVGGSINNQAANEVVSASAVIPVGHYYRVRTTSGTNTLSTWAELR
jgi:hypothetical protein